MAKNKVGLSFSAFEEYAEKLDKLGGDLKAVTEKVFQKSHEYITPKVHSAFKKHNQTGATEKSIADNEKVEWDGSVASIRVGFKISDGGLPSIFLMYGTPRVKKDQALYNSIRGSRTKKAIKELQEGIFAEEIKKVMGG